MKLLKSAFIAAAALAASAALSSCGDDNEFSTLEVYQQYQVIITPTTKSAFANLRDGTAAGECLHFTDNVLHCNTLTMYYSVIDPATTEFNYSCSLDSNHDRAIFSFKRNNKTTLVNEIEFDDMPDVSIPSDLTELTPMQSVRLNLGGYDISNADVYLLSGSHERFQAQLTPDGSYFWGAEVPDATYDLVVDLIRTRPTTQNDGSAGGSMTVIKRQIRRAVKVSR